MCFNVALLLKAKDCDRVFVSNDPVNFVDPWGLFSLGDARRSLLRRGVSPTYSGTQIFDEWLRLEKSDIKWLDEIRNIPCPRKLECDEGGKLKNPDKNIWKNPGTANPEHGNAVYEMRSRPTAGGHANQCTYDADGNIMTGIPEGGTADFAAHALPNFIPHFLHDYRPWKLAERLNRRDDYYNVRPEVIAK